MRPYRRHPIRRAARMLGTGLSAGLGGVAGASAGGFGGLALGTAYGHRLPQWLLKRDRIVRLGYYGGGALGAAYLGHAAWRATAPRSRKRKA